MLAYNHHLGLSFSWLYRVIAVFLVLSLGLTWDNGEKALAQEEQRDWSTPVNLSNSGTAQKPAILSDSKNNPLVLWGDTFSGFQYSSISDGVWSEPKDFRVPFGQFQEQLRYQFLSTGGGKTQVLWVDAVKRLYYSDMLLSSVDNMSGWKPGRLIAKDVDNFFAAYDEDGGVHVAYLVSEDTDLMSAGIYYTKITPEGKVFQALAMDQSPYFRRSNIFPSATGEMDPSLATLAVWSHGTGSSSTVFLSWNNPTTKRLYLRRSTDAGLNWDETLEIVTPDQRSASQVPQKPYLAMVGNDIFLLWQNNQEGVSCVQYYQSSTDGGVTWSDRRELFSEPSICPEKNIIFSAPNQRKFLTSINGSQVFIAIFKDNVLEPLQLQDELSSFADPVTYSSVQLRSQQMLLLDDRLYLVGVGGGLPSDIWVSSRSVDNLFNTENVQAVWRNPILLAQGQELYKNISLLASESGQVRAFWSQISGGKKYDPGDSIYYADWVTPGELTPRLILTSPEGKSDQPSAAVDSEGRMYVVWSGGKSGELFLSYSDIDQASTSLDWFEPKQMLLPSAAAANPILKVGLDGTLYLAYLAPLNEQRGVYLSRSRDRGETWSTPTQVFDAAAQNCAMVENLSYTITAADTQHMAWMCSTVPGGIGAYALHYARSSDQGQNWNVKIDGNEKTLIWGEVGGLSQENIHLVWLENTGGVYRLRDQLSKDDGVTWQPAEDLGTFNELVGPADLVIDPGGQLYLLMIAQESSNVVLNSWIFREGKWSSTDSRKLAFGQISLVNSLAAAVLPGGELSVLYSLEDTSPSTGLVFYSLVYLSRPVEVGAPIVTNSQQAVPANLATPMAEDELTPVPTEYTATPQPTLDLNALNDDGYVRTNSILIYVIGAILALVIVVFAVIISQYKRLRK